MALLLLQKAVGQQTLNPFTMNIGHTTNLSLKHETMQLKVSLCKADQARAGAAPNCSGSTGGLAVTTRRTYRLQTSDAKCAKSVFVEACKKAHRDSLNACRNDLKQKGLLCMALSQFHPIKSTRAANAAAFSLQPFHYACVLARAQLTSLRSSGMLSASRWPPHLI